MRKTFIVFMAVLCLFTSTACRTATGSGPSPDSSLVEIARIVARSFVYVELQNRGMSAEEASTALATLKAVVDAKLAGRSVYEVLNDSLWPQVREGVVNDLAKTLGSFERGGIKVFDDVTAKFIAEQAVGLVEKKAKARVEGGGE